MPNSYLRSITITAENLVTYPLFGGRPFRFAYLNGAGLPPIRRILQAIPMRDGVVDKGYRLEARPMQLMLYIDGLSEINTDQHRDQLAWIFAPTTSPLKLTCTRLDGTVRQIDCYLNGTLDMPQSERTSGQQLIMVPLIAPDPTFYDPLQITTTASLSTGSATPTLVATGTTADDWPIIEVTGPITTLKIDHSPVTDKLWIIGTIPALETWRFDLRPGYKTLQRISDSANRMNFMDTNYLTGFSTMRMVSEKVCAIYSQTSNIFVVTGTGVTAASSISIKSYRRYLSL